jgi:hypothetical protein
MSVSRRWQLVSCWHLLQVAVWWGAVYRVQRGTTGHKIWIGGKVVNNLAAIVHNELPVSLAVWEAQWFPAIWTQLACDGCSHLSEVNSLLGYWYQFLLHLDTCLGTMGQMLEYHWCRSESSDVYCVPMCHVCIKIGMKFSASGFVTLFFETPLC